MKRFRFTDKHSIGALYTGYVVQAIVNMLAPLFYAIFNTSLGISLGEVGLIATVNFAVQILTDITSTLYVDKIGYRRAAVLAHFLSAAGLIGLSVLPVALPSPYIGILIATVLMASGGGLIEVIISPMIEAMPTENKEKQMSLLHSFYCWGHAGVVIVSTLFLTGFGTVNWSFLPIIWALIPLVNAFLLMQVPVYTLKAKNQHDERTPLFKSLTFWLFLLMMVAAGASELSMSMWASYFAEIGLGVDKAIGDLLGPCLFALLMGVGRLLSANLLAGRLAMEKTLFIAAAGCTLCYAGAVFLQNPVFSLLGCGFTGFFVSVMWPGTYSLGAARMIGSGTHMFAFLAFAGDIGCAAGSYIVGLVSDLVTSGSLPFLADFLPASGIGIRAGLLVGILFPLLMLFSSGFLWLRNLRKNKNGISGI